MCLHGWRQCQGRNLRTEADACDCCFVAVVSRHHVLTHTHTCCPAPVAAPFADTAGQETHVSLPDVCFKPFGTTCATQSILQFWQMNMSYYETG